MTGRELEHLYAKHRARVQERLARYADSDYEEDDSDELDEPQETPRLAQEGSILVAPPAYLSIRISGTDVQQGSIDTDLFDDVVVPFQGELKATSRDGGLTRLELVSITSGSTILHFQPRLVAGTAFDFANPEAEAQTMASSIERVLDTHDLIEQGATGAEIRADRPSALLDNLARLTAGLIRHDAELEVLWRPRSGRRRPSRLGRRGIAYASELFERRETVEPVEVAGYVYSLSLTGQLVLKRNVAKRNSPTYSIEVFGGNEQLSQFNLNDFVRLNVMRTVVADQLGRTLSTSYRLISVILHQPQLSGQPPLDDDERS